MTATAPTDARPRLSTLLMILLLAAGLRFYRLDLVEYKLDEANLSRMALDMATGQGIPLRGLGSSVGLPNGPLSVWLLAIPYAFSRSPIVATGFVAALNVLAIAMTFALTRRMFGARVAWVSALLFAVAPWAILNSRKLWAQDLLPPFVVGYLWTAYLAFAKNKPWWLVLHSVILSACIQLHYSALTFVPLTLVWMIFLWWKRWPWKVITIALIASLASIAPFAYQMMRETTGASLAQITTLAQPTNATLKLDTEALRFAWLMTTGIDLHSLAGPDEFGNFLSSTLNFQPLFHLMGVLAVAGFILSLRQVARNKTVAEFMVATMLLFPILLFTAHTTPVYPHYFILTFPSQFILAGILIEGIYHKGAQATQKIYKTGRSLVASAALVCILAIAVAQVYAFLSIQNFVGSRATPGGYGTPAGMLLRVVQAAEQRSRAMGNAEIIVNGSSDNVRFDSEAAAFDVLLDPHVPRRFVNMMGASVYPASNAVFVNRVLPGQSGPIQLALRTGEGGYRLTDWDGKNQLSLSNNLADQFLTRLASPQSFVNGVAVWAYHVYGGRGGELRFRLAWFVVSAPPPATDYHWTNQLFDIEGKRVWQKDDVGLATLNWRIGDLVITDFAAPLDAAVKPGAYTMHVGMYTYPDLKTVPTTDWQPYVEVGPIDIK